jgi:hypothetical protein
VKEKLANAIQAYLAGNHDRNGNRVIYGIRVTDIRPSGRLPDGDDIDLEFRFLRGGDYCCTELGCHFLSYDLKGWQSLRLQMHKQDVSVGNPMTIRIRVVVEAGAICSGQMVLEPIEYFRIETELPTAQEINPNPEILDGETAVHHFLGKSRGEITNEFRNHGMSYQRDLMFMGPFAFCYYCRADFTFVEFYGGPATADMVAALCGVIEYRLAKNAESIDDAFPDILDFVDHVMRNYGRYGLIPQIFEHLRPRLSAIRSQVTHSTDN